MVVGIMAILLGIVTTAASESIKAARTRKADAVCALVQAGFAAYYAQKGEWPGTVGAKIENGSIRAGENQNTQTGDNQYTSDPNVYVLTRTEIDECLRDMVGETKKRRPVMDISGLYVSKDEGRWGQVCFGVDFMQAASISGMKEAKSSLVRATGGRRLKVSQMHFGYPDPKTGHFRHFKVVYSIPSDTFTVSKMESSHDDR